MLRLRPSSAFGSFPAHIRFQIERKPVTVMGLEFKNPVSLAAGLDKNGDYIDALTALGSGFVEMGTVTPRPQPSISRSSTAWVLTIWA